MTDRPRAGDRLGGYINAADLWLRIREERERMAQEAEQHQQQTDPTAAESGPKENDR